MEVPDGVGWWGEHTQIGTIRRSAVILEAEGETIDHVRVVSTKGTGGRPLPGDVQFPIVEDGGPSRHAWVRKFGDDIASVDVR